MCLSVGSSNSLIDDIGHVGMCEFRCQFNRPNLSGPKSRWLGADFGPKPLKRPRTGSPGPGHRSRLEIDVVEIGDRERKGASPAFTGAVAVSARRPEAGRR